MWPLFEPDILAFHENLSELTKSSDSSAAIAKSCYYLSSKTLSVSDRFKLVKQVPASEFDCWWCVHSLCQPLTNLRDRLSFKSFGSS